MEISAFSASKVLVAMNEAQNQRRALLFANKNQFRNWWRKCSQKLSRQLSLIIEARKAVTQYLAFSFCVVSVRGNDTQSLKVANLSSNQLDVWTGCVVMWVKRANTNKNHTRKLSKEKQKVCSSIQEFWRWFWRKASMRETDYTHILAKRTRGKFYLPSNGFRLQQQLRAEKFNTNTNRGTAAKNYPENWAWKSRRVKWLCILWPFQSILFLLEGRKHKKS